MYDLLIKNGNVVIGNEFENLNIGIKDNKITLLSSSSNYESDNIVDAKNLIILPGVIDSQVHFREPGSEYKEDFEKNHGARLGFMGMFVKASMTALREYPAVNAEIHGTDIVYKNFYNIGVAVGTPQGLVVPVLKDAQDMSLSDIEKTIADFGMRARDGKLGPADMMNGTFTISNGGVYGSLMSTPIINPPQSAILGMHKIQKRPVAVGDKIEIRPMMYLALSYDHRIIDGREAVSFLVRIKESIEDPRRLLLGV